MLVVWGVLIVLCLDATNNSMKCAVVHFMKMQRAIITTRHGHFQQGHRSNKQQYINLFANSVLTVWVIDIVVETGIDVRGTICNILANGLTTPMV